MQQRTLDNIAPRGKYLLVQRDPADEKVGNIILAGSAVKPKTTGTVVRVGDKVEALTEGDRIIFGQWVQQR
jgi:co-chaperonin GroES (HSP10)